MNKSIYSDLEPTALVLALSRIKDVYGFSKRSYGSLFANSHQGVRVYANSKRVIYDIQSNRELGTKLVDTLLKLKLKTTKRSPTIYKVPAADCWLDFTNVKESNASVLLDKLIKDKKSRKNIGIIQDFMESKGYKKVDVREPASIGVNYTNRWLDLQQTARYAYVFGGDAVERPMAQTEPEQPNEANNNNQNEVLW